jgi:hypothetical protein
VAKIDPKREFPASWAERGDFTNIMKGLEANIQYHFYQFNELDGNDGPLKVARCGRTTDWTFGQINAAMAKLYRKGYEDFAKPYGYTGNWYGGAWIIGA